MPKLLVHIGAGKTGSSSIQKTLRANQEHLKANGFKYLGLMLEHVEEKSDFDWNFIGGSDLFFEHDPEKVISQASKVLRAEIESLRDGSIHTLIWSNEWMFTRDAWIVPILNKIRDDGNEVEIVCYVRRHDKWAQSAYSQWGIKHKTYKGPLRNFREWKAGRSFNFLPSFQPWQDAFEGSCNLFNYDTSGEIVSHFCRKIGYSPQEIIRDNVTPSSELMAAWAVFNSRFDSEVPAARFESLANEAGLLAEGSLRGPDLSALYPTPEDMAQIREDCSADFEALNELLGQFNEPLLSNEPFEMRRVDLNESKMDLLLLKLVFSLQRQIGALRDEINRLRDSNFTE